MIHYHLLEVLPERCFMLLTVSGTKPPPLGVGFNAGFTNGFSIDNLTVIAYGINGKFIAQQAQGVPALRHLNVPCEDADQILNTMAALSRAESHDDRRLRLARITSEMVYELERAEIKHPEWTSDACHAASILSEECGEATQAAVDFNNTGDRKHLEYLEAETIQTGAMCLRLLLNLDQFRKPIDARTVNGILDDATLDDSEKLFEIRNLIKG